MQFSTSLTNTSTNSLTNSGVATIYAEGEQFIGNAFGAVSGSTISATYYGISAPTIWLPNLTFNTNGSINTITYTATAVTNTCSGQFSAQLYNAVPNQNFSGKGSASVDINTVNLQTFFPYSTNVAYPNTTVIGNRLVN
jgi:hypothetical protein